jgi:hypothetical protein
MPFPHPLLLELYPPDDEGPLMKAVCEDIRTAMIRAAMASDADGRTDQDISHEFIGGDLRAVQLIGV